MDTREHRSVLQLCYNRWTGGNHWLPNAHPTGDLRGTMVMRVRLYVCLLDKVQNLQADTVATRQ